MIDAGRLLRCLALFDVTSMIFVLLSCISMLADLNAVICSIFDKMLVSGYRD